MQHKAHYRFRFVTFMLVGFILVGLGLVGCTPKFTTPTLVAARGGDVSELNPIAVVNFSGNGGNELRNDVEAMLVRTKVQGQPYFTVVDRQTLDKVLEEIGLGMSGIIDEKTAVRVGKHVGAKGMVIGAVGNNNVFDTDYTQERFKCLDVKCKDVRYDTVRCIKRDAHFSFTPKIIDVATGRIVISDSLAGTKSARSCQGDRPITDKTALLSDAKQEAMEKFRRLVAPFTVNVSLVVLTKDDTERPKRATEMLKNGAKWAKSGRLDRACKLWRESYQSHPYGYAVHYDLGLCEEYYTRDLQAALKYYQQADELTPQPVKAISTALNRVRHSALNEAKLDAQLDRDKPAHAPHKRASH